MKKKQKEQLKKEWSGPGKLRGLGTLDFDLLKSLNIDVTSNRNSFGVPMGNDVEISITLQSSNQPKNAQMIKVGSGKIDSLSYDREYGINLYLLVGTAGGTDPQFTMEFYEKDK